MENTRSLSSELKKVIRPFRQKINHAEDRVDIMNCFSTAAVKIVKNSIKNNADIRLDDITLGMDSPYGFTFSERIRAMPEFMELLMKTDIESQISHLAGAAGKRYKHLSGHPEKTRLKIRQR